METKRTQVVSPTKDSDLSHNNSSFKSRSYRVLRVARKVSPPLQELDDSEAGELPNFFSGTVPLTSTDGRMASTAIVGPLQLFQQYNQKPRASGARRQLRLNTMRKPTHTEEPTTSLAARLREIESTRRSVTADKQNRTISHQLLQAKDGKCLANYNERTQSWGRISRNLATALSKPAEDLLFNCGQDYREKLEAAELLNKAAPLHWCSSLRTPKDAPFLSGGYVPLGHAFSGVYMPARARQQGPRPFIRAPFSSQSKRTRLTDSPYSQGQQQDCALLVKGENKFKKELSAAKALNTQYVLKHPPLLEPETTIEVHYDPRHKFSH